MKRSLLLIFFLVVGLNLMAQPQRRNFASAAIAEKDSVMAKIDNLSDDQKMIIESLYTDYQSSLTALLEKEVDDRQALRQEMQKVGQEKDQLMKEVLDDEQWIVFLEMQEAIKLKRQEQRKNRGGSGRQKRAGN